jgi:hypothetical protein
MGMTRYSPFRSSSVSFFHPGEAVAFRHGAAERRAHQLQEAAGILLRDGAVHAFADVVSDAENRVAGVVLPRFRQGQNLDLQIGKLPVYFCPDVRQQAALIQQGTSRCAP